MTFNKECGFVFKTLGRVVYVAAVSFSVFIIIASMTSKNEKNISQDRLRKAYDGLSPRDYQ